MKVRALRGVCVGVDQHLKAGDIVDLDAASVVFLKSIGAVEVAHESVVVDSHLPAEKEPANLSGADKKVLRDEADATQRHSDQQPADKTGKEK